MLVCNVSLRRIAYLSRDLRALYFSSDRSLSVKFPRTRDQAKQDLARLLSWDSSNYNVWFMPWRRCWMQRKMGAPSHNLN
jgi:hypothetical protein